MTSISSIGIKLLKVIFYYVLGVIGIICISVMPEVFRTKGFTDIGAYFQELGRFMKDFFNPDAWIFIYKERPEPIVEFLWDPFVYSMQVLISAILLGFFIAAILAFAANFLPKAILQVIKKILGFLEAIPDLLVAILLQMLVVFIARKTGIVLFGIATLSSDDRIYLAPIITLAILPLISLFKIMLIMIEEELLKDYVEFAKSKGIKKKGILFFHVLKNITPSSFYHSKVIVWGALSSLLVVERVFNIMGITHFITLDFRPMTIAVSLMMIFTPFFFFYQLVDFWMGNDKREAVSLRLNRGFSLVNPIHIIRDSAVSLFQTAKQTKWLKIKPWRPFIGATKTLFTHMKNVKFAIGFLFFLSVILYSVIYSIVTNSKISQERFRYDEKGTIIDGPPHPPTEPFLLGSDHFGFSIYDQLVVGAKYTLIFAFLIAFLRVFIGFLLGTVFAFKLNAAGQKWIEKLVDSIHFLPLSIIAYLLLSPVLMMSNHAFQYSLTERITFEVVILTLLVIPLTTVLTGNEMKQVMKEEFIVSARVLGGSPFHMMKKHVLPHLGPRMTILFGQQFIQTLLIFIHLGLFSLFFGGTIIKGIGRFGDPPRSLTNEWSGMIGQMRNGIGTGNYWLILFVLLAFMLSIFAMQLIIQGVKEVQQVKVGVMYRQKHRKVKKRVKSRIIYKHQIDEESFSFIKEKHQQV